MKRRLRPQCHCGDMDFNGHIHNARYIGLAAQGFPAGTVSPNSLSEIRIVYSGGIREGENVTARYACLDATHYVTLCADGAVRATVAME